VPKNLCKQSVLVQLIIKNVVTCYFWNTVYFQGRTRNMLISAVTFT